MIFLLTHECVVDVREIEALICVHSIMWYWSKMHFNRHIIYYANQIVAIKVFDKKYITIYLLRYSLNCQSRNCIWA